MNHSNVVTQPTKVLHGLHFLWAVPDEIPGLVSAESPAVEFSVGSSPIRSRSKQVVTLSGADADPTAGTATFKLLGTPTAGPVLKATFHGVPLGSRGIVPTLANGPYHDVECEFVLQSNTTLTTGAAGLVAVINIAIAGTGTVTNGRIRSTDKFAQLSDIGYGMALMYDNAAASTGTVTVTGADSGGVIQNEFNFTIEILEKAPGLLAFSPLKYPNIPGVRFLGATLDPVLDLSSTENDIVCGQSFTPIDSYATANNAVLTGLIVEDQNIQNKQLLQQIGARASTDNYEIFLHNFLPAGQTYGLVLTSDSNEFPGNTNYLALRKIRSNNSKYEYKKEHTPVPFNFKLVKAGATDLLYEAQYRPSIV